MTRTNNAKPWIPLFVFGAGTLLTHGFGLALVPALLPYIADELSARYDDLGRVVALGLFAYAVGAISTGWVMRRLPLRTVVMTTFVCSAAGLAAVGMAGGIPALTLAVVVMGLVAPISWTGMLRAIDDVVDPSRRAFVMAGASSGAAVGVLLNGVAVQTSATVHSWRLAFFVAAATSIVPLAGSLRLVPADPPTGAAPTGGLRTILAHPTGRLVVAAGLVAGLSGFPLSAFLSATAIDEIGMSAIAAGGLWWLVGVAGTLAGPLFGRLGDRTTARVSLRLGTVAYAVGAFAFLVMWNGPGLVAAVLGYTAMNYPIWGLTGAAASDAFAPLDAARSISLGLVAAALGGSMATAIAGAMIDTTGSMRPAVAALIVVPTAAVSIWYTTQGRRLEPEASIS